MRWQVRAWLLSRPAQPGWRASAGLSGADWPPAPPPSHIHSLPPAAYPAHPTTPQVLLLSNGLLMYQGPTAQLVPWFSQQLGFTYEPERHGAASDWVLDLLALGFARTSKPKVGGAHAAC